MGTFRSHLSYTPLAAPAAREAGEEVKRPAHAGLSLVAVFLFSLAAILALQVAHGAYTASVGAYPDESAHVVTSLMYRQFLLEPTPDPLQFAKSYYGHYPYLAAGHWPPMLHFTAAVWAILVGSGKTQFIAYLALAVALTATLLYRSILTIGSAWLAAAFVGMWIMLAQSQLALTRFMTEAPLTLFTLFAVVVYVRYLRSPSYRLALLFAGLAAAAILTKETAVALALVPPIAVAAGNQWKLLKTGHFWLPAPLVAALVVPWHIWIVEIGVGRFRQGAVQRLLLKSYSSPEQRLALFAELLGWPLLLLAIIGLAVWIARRVRDREAACVWGAHAGLLVGGLIVLLAAPESREVRHLQQLSPSLVLFAAAGAWALTKHLHAYGRTAGAVLIGTLCIFLSPASFAPNKKIASSPSGSNAIATYLTTEPGAHTILVFSDGGVSEGPLIAELALLEPMPKRLLLRSSKTIYTTNWDATKYRQLIATSADLEDFIDSSGVDTIVRLTGPDQPQRPDDGILLQTVAAHPDEWARVEIDLSNDAQVYRRIIPSKSVRQPIRIQMSSKLGHDLIIEPGSAGGSPKHLR